MSYVRAAGWQVDVSAKHPEIGLWLSSEWRPWSKSVTCTHLRASAVFARSWRGRDDNKTHDALALQGDLVDRQLLHRSDGRGHFLLFWLILEILEQVDF